MYKVIHMYKNYCGIIVLLSGLLGSGCIETTSIEQPIELEIQPASNMVDADEATVTEVTVTLPTFLPATTDIKFITDTGKFRTATGELMNSVIVSSSNSIAKAHIVSPNVPGNATIIARNASASGTTSMEFVAAGPENIDVFLDRIIAPADGTTAITVTASLRRDKGKVSPGRIVQFEVREGPTVTNLGGSTLSDKDGMAMIKIISTTPLQGELYVRVEEIQSDPRQISFITP